MPLLKDEEFHHNDKNEDSEHASTYAPIISIVIIAYMLFLIQ